MSLLKEGNIITLSDSGLRFHFDAGNGSPISIEKAGMSIEHFDFTVEAGCNGIMQPGKLKFYCLDGLNTWELPRIIPSDESPCKYSFKGCRTEKEAIIAEYTVGDLHIAIIYKIEFGNLVIDTELSNGSDDRKIINGIAFVFSAKDVDENTSFDFPCNIPAGDLKLSEMQTLMPIETGLINPAIHIFNQGKNFNLIFLDSEEKWGTGVYKDKNGALTCVNSAGVESYLDSGEKLHCGKYIIQPVGESNPYLAIRALYKNYGWNPPSDGIKDGVLYSCHPSGTMDKNFPLKRTMYEYAEELEALKDLGIDHIWVLPLFEHRDRGVYHPADQAVIDERYGGDEAVKYYCDKARKLGMTVMFDYVPHGPHMDDPLGIAHREWASTDRNGEPVIEWDCLSFDMANPVYQQDTKDLVKDHIRRFGLGGARIDCSMGGLPNWSPYPGNRPSNSNLKGGVAISRSIREAFTEMGIKPFVTPENFNPLPFYFAYTDAFYDMPLYRVLFELEEAKLCPADFVHRLTKWLRAELESTPEGYNKQRFLGNHDTVSWVFSKARAAKSYGEEKAKALWVMISTIDGIPMIYQGDEDPSLIGDEGPSLREFFTELFKARKDYLGNRYDMEYELTGTPVMAYRRKSEDKIRQVLINFSPESQIYRADFKVKDTLFGSCGIKQNEIVLKGYGWAMLDITE
jgi:hypothetical protein